VEDDDVDTLHVEIELVVYKRYIFHQNSRTIF